MTDTMTTEQRSAHMAKIKGRRTKPELVFHGILKGNRVRHKMWPDLHGHPDCVIYGEDGERDVAVFVNGCFWHGCPKHFKCPKSNKDFWMNKIARNAVRQMQVSRRLRAAGYSVVVLWEHDIIKGIVKKFT